MKILITGGTGSLGSALARKWVAEGHHVTIVSRDDQKQAQLRPFLNGTSFHAINIDNALAYRQLVTISSGQDFCIHAAALKIVAEGEYQPFAYLNTNIIGTLHVIDAWRETHGDCTQLLYINSDKAVEPLTTYGYTKGVGAALARADCYNAAVLRYGNVVGSNGSFLQAWKRQLTSFGRIRVKVGQPSGQSPTRFFLTMDNAVCLVEEALELMRRGEGGVLLSPRLRAFSVMDVARATGLDVEVSNIDQAEKLHESLLADGEGWQPTSSSALGRRTMPWWPGPDYYAPFRSNTAPRMSGEEVLEVMGWR